MMTAKQTRPMTGVITICAPGRIEMKVIEMPASEPSSAARGVILRMYGAIKPPPISTKLCTNTQVRPASQACTGSLVVIRIGSMITNTTTNMCGTVAPDGGRAALGAAVLLAQPIGEPGVIHRAQAQHQPGGGQDAAEHQFVRHL